MKPSAPLLQIDAGNTFLKWRLIEGGVTLARGRSPAGATGEIFESWAGLVRPAEVWVSSVAAEALDKALEAYFREQHGVVPRFVVSEAQCNGLRNGYERPQTLGVDRWLVMLAARELAAGAFCVVDAGSALTIDRVDGDGQHEGGFILPGRSLMEGALLRATSRVRDREAAAALDVTPGRSTASAVSHGVSLALLGAVEKALQEAERSGPARELFVTGGDGPALAELLQRPLTLVEDLVLDGLSAVARAEARAPA